MFESKLYIDGAWVEPSGTYPIPNPATEAFVADAPDDGPLALSKGAEATLARHRSAAEPVRKGAGVDRGTVEDALRAEGGNVKRTAARLGKDRGQLYRILKRLGVDPAAFRPR